MLRGGMRVATWNVNSIRARLEQLLEWLDRMNPRNSRTGARGVTIKTLQYVEDDPTGIMLRIGREHGGEDGYRMITLDDLVQEEES